MGWGPLGLEPKDGLSVIVLSNNSDFNPETLAFDTAQGFRRQALGLRAPANFRATWIIFGQPVKLYDALDKISQPSKLYGALPNFTTVQQTLRWPG